MCLESLGVTRPRHKVIFFFSLQKKNARSRELCNGPGTQLSGTPVANQHFGFQELRRKNDLVVFFYGENVLGLL